MGMAELNGAPATSQALQALGLTNFGHFTSMRAEDLQIRGLSHHLDRLVRDCRLIFGTDLDRDRVRSYVRDAVAGNRDPLIIRVTIYDPSLDLGKTGFKADPHVLVTSRPADPWPLAPLRVRSTLYRREFPMVKHVGLFGAMLCRRNAQLNGHDDVLFTDEASFVSEGATWNIGFFDGKRVVWPNADALPGITMRLLSQVHEDTTTAPINLRHVHTMQAAFASNTTIGVRAIQSIDEAQFPANHPILDILRKEYAEIPGEDL
jgi:branched-subunit amino acid aminotransferase/4-amino-4-deoxychorismate lyase